jgi:hypothetical protein
MTNKARDQLVSMRRWWDLDIPPFAGREESFLLSLIAESPYKASGIDWTRLSRFFFVLPHFHYLWKQYLPADVPGDFVEEAKRRYLSNLSANERRLKYIASLAQSFEKNGLKVVFLKGAAELARFHEDSDYLARRFMIDVDVLCSPGDLRAVDSVLATTGNMLFDHSAGEYSRDEMIARNLEESRHCMYNRYTEMNLEVHPHVPQPECYPDDFTQLLLDESECLNVLDANIWVPKPEHLFVYFFCNATSSRDQDTLIDGELGFLFDLFAAEGSTLDALLLNQRLDSFQVFFLLRLSDLLGQIGPLSNTQEIERLLSTVKEDYFCRMYLDLAAFYLPGKFPLTSQVTGEDIYCTRQKYMSNFCIPLLVINELQSDLEARLVPLIEARLAPVIETRVMERLKSALIRKTEKKIPRPLHAALARLVDGDSSTTIKS